MPVQRLDAIDALRGIAIVWMTIYHFFFDLNHFGWLKQDFYSDPVWTWQRSCIVGLFLLCAGIGQAVAVWKRWFQVAGCALLVTGGSYFMFPASFIYFGVLHGIALMLIVVRLTAGWGRWLWLAGALAIVLKLVAVEAHAAWPGLEFLNGRAWNWLGLVGRKPVTEDYVPIVPWLGMMWWGMAAGQWLLARRRQVVAGPIPPALGSLAWLGRWSLSWYMLHQPVLIAAVMGFTAIAK